MSVDPHHDGHNPLLCAQDAPEAVPERIGRLQGLSYAAIEAVALEGLTAHETSLATGFDRSAIQPRISELRCKGLVIASGRRRRNPSGKTATVWIASHYADALPHPPIASQ